MIGALPGTDRGHGTPVPSVSWILGLLLGGLALLPIGCVDSLLWAVGKTENLGLITNLDPSDPRVGLLAGVLEKPVQMVRPEPRFKVQLVPPDRFSSQRDRKCLAVVADLGASGELDDAIGDLISSDIGRDATTTDDLPVD